MADGTVKPIDQVEPGDEVLATDPETGEKEAKRVEATHGHDDVVLTLVLTTSTGEKREIRTTEDHPFWSETEREFQRADELDPGELVLTADGGAMEVDAVLTEEVSFEPAWNLTVQGLHTYSVIAAGAGVGAGSTRGPPVADRTDAVLVHNCSLLLNRANELATSLPGWRNTVAVARAERVGDNGETVYQTIVATNRMRLPKQWSGADSPLYQSEKFFEGKGHAEATIMNKLGSEWKITEIASSTRICPSCMAQAVGNGLRKGVFGIGWGWSRTGNTRFRVVYR